MRSTDTWRVADGEFVEHWDELDLLELFQQLGVISLDLATMGYVQGRRERHGHS
jgi:hypothetical protein